MRVRPSRESTGDRAAGGVYHIGGDRELSNLELTGAILRCCGSGWDMVERVPDRKGHDRRYALDDSLLRGLGYTPGVGFEQGLAATMRWYQENRHLWEPLKRAAAQPGGPGSVSQAAPP